MEDSLLYMAARTWNRLCNFSYDLTYGFRKQIYTIHLSFSPRDFPHLAGFQYLKDIFLSLPSPAKLAARILEGKITQAQIEKALEYEEMVKPRLLALEKLDEILDNEFILYSFMARFSPFTTQIHADYLISSCIDGISFIFLIRSDRKELVCDCVCSSAFVKGDRDFKANQRHYTILKRREQTFPTTQRPFFS